MSDEAWRELHALFHMLWSRDVGPGYDKTAWKRLEAHVFRDAPEGFMREPREDHDE